MRTYEFIRTGRPYRVHVIESGRRRALPMFVAAGAVSFPMGDAVFSMLVDYLGEGNEFQAVALMTAMVSKLRRYIAQQCNKNNEHFAVTETEVGLMVADLLVNSYKVRIDAAYLTVEYITGERRDLLRQALDACNIPSGIS